MPDPVSCEPVDAGHNDRHENPQRQVCGLARVIAAGACVLLFYADRGQASQSFLVTANASGGAAAGAGIFRLEDINGDGDALDVGENVLWGRGIQGPGDLHRFGARAVLAADPFGRIMRLEDVNGDGDALDVGESTVWADGFASNWGLDMRADGRVLATDFSRDHVDILQDLNGDGDALDFGERVPFAKDIAGPLGILIRGSNAFVAASQSGNIHLLRDVNGDGDALDVGENVLYTPPGGLDSPSSLVETDARLFVSNRGRNAVFTVTDLNGDGDAMDIVELLSYADPFFSRMDGPWSMAAHPEGGLLVAENASGRVSRIRDINGDGDALDLGEATLFAAGLSNVVGIVLIPEPASIVIVIVCCFVGASLARRPSAM